MGSVSPLVLSSGSSSLEDLQGIHINPFLNMADRLQDIRLNPPPTKKWVTFADWDEEALEYSSSPPAAAQPTPMGRRHSLHDLSAQLSSSVSSETSLGSAGEGGNKSMSQLSNFSASVDETSPPTMFNASFGGYRQNGDAATLRTVFTAPSRKTSTLITASSQPTTSSAESVRSDSSVGSPPTRIRFSSFNELKSFTSNLSELNMDGRIASDPSKSTDSGEEAKYSAFDNVREGGAYLGWSNDVLGTTFGWSEGIKVEIIYLSWFLHKIFLIIRIFSSSTYVYLFDRALYFDLTSNKTKD